MAELADRLPGELILASYANTVRDRLGGGQRYASQAALDVSVPLPTSGDGAYLQDEAKTMIFDGFAWQRILDARGGIVESGNELSFGTTQVAPFTAGFAPAKWYRATAAAPAVGLNMESEIGLTNAGGFTFTAWDDADNIAQRAGVEALPVGNAATSPEPTIAFRLANDSGQVLIKETEMRSFVTTVIDTKNLQLESVDSTIGLRLVRAGRTLRIDSANAGFEFVNFRTEQSDLYFRFSPGTSQRMNIRNEGIEIINSPLILADSSKLVLNQSTGLTGTNYGLPLAHPPGTAGADTKAQLIVQQAALMLDTSGETRVAAATTTGGKSVQYNDVGGVTITGSLNGGTFFGLRLSTTSSERNKKVLKTAMAKTHPHHPANLLNVKFKQWRYRDDYLAEDDERSGAKFFAPTAESIEAAMPFAVNHDADGQPESPNDLVMISSLLWLVQDLNAKVNMLLGR